MAGQIFNYRYAEEKPTIDREKLEILYSKYNAYTNEDDINSFRPSCDHECIIEKMIKGKSDNELDISRLEWTLPMDKREALHILTKALILSKVNAIYLGKQSDLLETEAAMCEAAIYIIRNSTVRRVTTSGDYNKTKCFKPKK